MSSFPIKKDALDVREDMVVAEDQHGLTARFHDKSIANLDTDSIEAGWEDLLKDSFSELSVTPDEGVAVDSDTFLQAILSGRDDITGKKEAAVCLCYLEEEGAVSLDNGTVELVPSDFNDSSYDSKMSYNMIAYLEAQVDRWSHIIEQYDRQLDNLDDLIDDIEDEEVEKQEQINQLEGEIKELCGELIPPENATAVDSVAENEHNLSNDIVVPDEVKKELSSEDIQQYKIKWDGIIELQKEGGEWGVVKLGRNTFALLMSLKKRAENRVNDLESQIPQLREQIALSAHSFQGAMGEVDLEDIMEEQAMVMDWYDEFEKTAENEIESSNDVLETYKQGAQAKAKVKGIESEEVEERLGDEEGIGNLSSSPSG